MTPDQVASVSSAVKQWGTAADAELLKAATTVVTRCAKDAVCYAKALDEPIASATPAGRMPAIKAAVMAGVYGDDATKAQLVSQMARSPTEPSVRRWARPSSTLLPTETQVPQSQ